MSALRKVLVVDDDPVVGASFHRVLSGKGYLVVSAGNGADALEKLSADHFDAVFTDLRMPGMDGMQVAEKVRAQQPWLPVVIVTGYGSPASEERARAAGVTEFLHKPLSPEMIEASAGRAVRTVPEAAAMPAAAEQAAAAPPPEAEAPPREAEAQPRFRLLRNMALFLISPFVGLAYMLLLPFVGMGMLLWVAAEPVIGKQRMQDAAAAAKFMLKLAAAPFIGLAWIVVAPFAGLAALAWMAAKALFGRPAAQ